MTEQCPACDGIGRFELDQHDSPFCGPAFREISAIQYTPSERKTPSGDNLVIGSCLKLIQEFPAKFEECFHVSTGEGRGPDSFYISRDDFNAAVAGPSGFKAEWCEACARYEERIGPGEKCLDHQRPLDPIRVHNEDHSVDPNWQNPEPLSAIASMEDSPLALEPHERAARRYRQVALSYRKGRGTPR